MEIDNMLLKNLRISPHAYIILENIMEKIKLLCNSIIRKEVHHGYKFKVQIAIKYLIFGIFQIFNLE